MLGTNVHSIPVAIAIPGFNGAAGRAIVFMDIGLRIVAAVLCHLHGDFTAVCAVGAVGPLPSTVLDTIPMNELIYFHIIILPS